MTAYRQSMHAGVNPYSAGTDEHRRFGEDRRALEERFLPPPEPQHAPLTPDQLQQIRCFAQRYGPSNCWTGELGLACSYIRLLLREIGMEHRQLMDV